MAEGEGVVKAEWQAGWQGDGQLGNRSMSSDFSPSHTCGPSAHHHKVQHLLHVVLAGARQRGQLKLLLDALAQRHAV